MTQDDGESSGFPWTYFVLAFGISWLIWLPGVLATQALLTLPVPFIVFFFVGTWGPFLAASWAVFREGGWGRMKKFWRRGLDSGFSKIWLVIMLGLVLLVTAVPLGFHRLFGGSGPETSLLAQPWMVLPVFLTYFLTGGGNEEWGWRGYALDRLQRGWDPLRASVILGLIWGCWHIPLFFIKETGQYHMPLLVFILGTPELSLLHTWIYNKTGGNLLAAWVFHAFLGVAWEVFPIISPGVAGYQRVLVYDFWAATVIALVILYVEGRQLGYTAA